MSVRRTLREVVNTLKTWRRHRRDSELYQKAIHRAGYMTEPELVAQVDLALMHSAGALNRYRHVSDKEIRQDQLREVRINLEACLAMLESVLPD